MRRLLRRPSPATVIATLALFVALGGTGYALTLPANSVGSAQIQAGRVLNSKLHPGSVSNSRLGRNAVTFSKLASNQMNSTKIRNRSLLGEDLADETVTGTQINEGSLNITKFALVNAGGVLESGSTGVTVAQVGIPVIVNFGASQAGRPLNATLAASGTDLTGQISAAPCGGPTTTNPNGITCPAAVNNPSHIAVYTADKAGAAKGLPFSLSVPQS